MCSMPPEDSTIGDPDVGSFSMAIKAKAFRANYPCWELKLDIVFDLVMIGGSNWFMREDEGRSYQDYKEEQKLHSGKQIFVVCGSMQ